MDWGRSLLTYALCVEELARGWMSVSGVLNTHFIVAYMLRQHGTDAQKQRLLPRMATGESRGAFSMSEPELGSDVAAIRTRAQRNPDGNYTINGQKMWLTNGGSSTLVAVLVRTDEGADKPHRNLTAFLVEKPTGFGEGVPGLLDLRQDRQAGGQGHRHHRAHLRRLPGKRRRHPRCNSWAGFLPDDGRHRSGPGQRVRASVPARHLCVRASAVRDAEQRHTFGKPIAEHQAIAFQLAETATKVEKRHI